MTLETLRKAMLKIAGTDYGMHSPRWLSRHGDAARQAGRYREGRVLLAGDAAHIHFPAGGQGLNTGVQDAVNLGWKLAAVARGQAPDLLLDTYQAERHPVAARVLQNTRAQTALWRVDEHTSALREVLGELIGIDEVRLCLAGMITATDLQYPMEGPTTFSAAGSRISTSTTAASTNSCTVPMRFYWILAVSHRSTAS